MSQLPLTIAANAPMAYGLYKRARTISPQIAAASRFIQENQAGLSRAARTIQRGFRSYRYGAKYPRKRRAARGVRPNRDTSHNTPYSDNGYQNSFAVRFEPGISGYKGVVQRQLDVFEMKIPGLGQGSDNRLTNRIFLKGFNVCTQIFNTKNFPVVVQMALLQFPRRETGDDPDPKDKFFRADEQGDNGNALTFQNFSSNSAWDMRYICNSLNPDNKRILMRKKWILGARELNGGTEQSLHQAHYMTPYERYIRINRHVVLNGNADVNEQPFYMVFWCMPLDSNDMETGSASTHFRYNMRVKTYWKNVV